eukprot:3836740-Prymnesium_polylepis.1
MASGEREATQYGKWGEGGHPIWQVGGAGGGTHLLDEAGEPRAQLLVLAHLGECVDAREKLGELQQVLLDRRLGGGPHLLSLVQQGREEAT